MFNEVTLIGYLGRDPEISTYNNGTVRATLSVATSERHRDRNTGEIKELTEWHRCVAWRKTAEIAEKILKKGDLVNIVGKLTTRSWVNKDGVTQYTTEIQIHKILRLTNDKERSIQYPTSKKINYPEQPERPADEIFKEMEDNPYLNTDMDDIPF